MLISLNKVIDFLIMVFVNEFVLMVLIGCLIDELLMKNMCRFGVIWIGEDYVC